MDIQTARASRARRIEELEARRGRGENGLQTHLHLIHGYARSRLTGLEIIQLVFLHKRATDERGHREHQP